MTVGEVVEQLLKLPQSAKVVDYEYHEIQTVCYYDPEIDDEFGERVVFL